MLLASAVENNADTELVEVVRVHGVLVPFSEHGKLSVKSAVRLS